MLPQYDLTGIHVLVVMAKIEVLSPAGELRARVIQAPPLPDLRGKTVGFIDNHKTNFDELVKIMGATLREQYGVAQLIHHRKPHASVGATSEVLAEMARSCDLVSPGPETEGPVRRGVSTTPSS